MRGAEMVTLGTEAAESEPEALAGELCCAGSSNVGDSTACHPFSSVRVADGFVFLSGQGGWADHKLVDGGVTAETAQIFLSVEALLESVGASLDDVVSCLVHLADLDDYAAFEEEYAKHFPGEKPVRTIVHADLPFGMHISITVIAKQP
jgi:enamine deaminase RidA (YjgF/YER057c/UK114 family)